MYLCVCIISMAFSLQQVILTFYRDFNFNFLKDKLLRQIILTFFKYLIIIIINNYFI